MWLFHDDLVIFFLTQLFVIITHTHTQPFYGSVEFVRENPGEPVPEEHSPTTLIVVINHPHMLHTLQTRKL